MAKLAFWYEFASTYSYLSAMRIEVMAREAGVEIEWRPFLLGPIFVSQGWNTSPFNIYEAKGRYMWRDMERICAARGLPLRRPEPFPQNGLHAARLALAGAEEGWAPGFSRAVYAAEFGDGADISDRQVLADLLAAQGLDAAAALSRMEETSIKQRLKDQTEEARGRGLFGAPSFLVGDEIYWGDDRLEPALAHAAAT